MTTMKAFLPNPTTFGSRKADYCKGHLVKQESVKHKGKQTTLSQKKLPETEEDFLALYQDRILNAQRRQLFPLQEDLADWLNKTLGRWYTYVNAYGS
ncbi:hypothetical protein RUM44_008105 [Polyplax serrata]|uniref:Transposase n=1 Tax=Polyplax serrata TaxID=468196 RepID=A0ABR1B7P3_POLSC